MQLEWGIHLVCFFVNFIIYDSGDRKSTKSKASISNYLSTINSNRSSVSVLPYQMHDFLQSRQILLSHKLHILNLCRNVFDKLFLSKIDSFKGISVVAEQPFNNPIMINILRPGVIRQYYGMNKGVVNNDIISRATYGLKSHVGTDPNKFITKPFDINMKFM